MCKNLHLMKQPSKTIKLSQTLKKFTLLEETTYIIYGSQEALALYGQSLEALLESDCYDFDVREYAKGKKTPNLVDDAFEPDGYLVIDENSFRKLHKNLCQKIKKFILDPRRERWLEHLELLENGEGEV